MSPGPRDGCRDAGTPRPAANPAASERGDVAALFLDACRSSPDLRAAIREALSVSEPTPGGSA